MNLEERILVLEARQTKTERQVEGNSARLMVAENDLDRIKKIVDYPPITIGVVDEEEREPSSPLDKLCEYKNGKPSAHPWHLSDESNEGAEYVRLDEEGNGVGWIMNPIKVSLLRNPDILTKREFITPSARFIQAARRGQSLGLHAAYNIPSLTPHIVGTLDVAFAHTHLGLSPYSYYHDRNDEEMEQEWGKSGCSK